MKSIRQQLIVALCLSLALLMALGGFALYTAVRSALQHEFDRALVSKAQALTILIEEEENGEIEFEFTDEVISDFLPGPGAEYFEIRRADGIILDASPSLKDHSLPQKAVPQEIPVFWNLPLPDGRPGRAVEFSFFPPPKEKNNKSTDKRSDEGAKIIVAVARERAGLDQTYRILLVAIVVSIIFIVVSVVLLVVSTVRKGLRPLAHLANKMPGISPENLQIRFPVEGLPVELKPICEKLNDLLVRLEAAFVRERRFSADVAHELRTPLAELRSMTEVALKWPEDKALSQRALQEALGVAKQMERLVESLLHLTRSEGKRRTIATESVDLPSIIRVCWQRFEGKAQQKQLSIAFDMPAECAVQSDDSLLRSIFSNLFSNTVEYAPQRDEIVCRITSENKTVTVAIENTNDDLKPENVTHIFEPFWRQDASRSDSDHDGLGLSLVAAFTRLLGIEVSASISENKRFQVSLKFQD